MFVSAVSSKGAETFKPNDPLGAVGDLSPATFRVEFDEPLILKNADIELVSCKISKLNEIIINSDNNTINVRVGQFQFAEQYTAKIPHGNYNIDTLANVIADSLNEVMPCNVYKGWSASVVLDKIKLTWSLTAPYGFDAFKENVKDDVLCIQAGVPYPNRVNAGTNHIKFSVDDEYLDKIVSPLRIPDAEVWEYCGGVDIGAREPDYLTRTGIDQFGIGEKQKSNLEAILRPVECIIKSPYDCGYGGFDGTGDKPTYLTFEFYEYKNEDGTAVDPFYKYGGMFNQNTMKYNGPRKYANQEHRQINGVLNLVKESPDQRGAPYNKSKRMVFPYARQTINGSDIHKRSIYYDTTWTGQIQMRRGRGATPIDPRPNCPESYAFQMDDVTSAGASRKANCIAKRRGVETDKVKIRVSERPLIQGLPQQQSLNGDVTNTQCVVVNPLVVAPPKIRYKVGSVGKCNSTNFGETFWTFDQQQARLVTGAGDVVYKLPYYKINAVDVFGYPTEVVLTDGGEHIIPFDNTSPLSVRETSLFLNDPKTFDIVDGNDDEETIMNEQIFMLQPDATHIGPSSFSEQKKAYRYASFNLALQRDDIFQRQLEPIPPVGYRGVPDKLRLTKDLEIDVTTVMENPDGSARPDDSQINVTIHQLQPRAISDQAYDDFVDNVDVRRCLFNANSGSWNSKNGDGTTGGLSMTNWTTFVGAADKDGAIKLTIGMRNMLTQNITISHNTNYPANPNTFVQTVVLNQTGVTRGGSGDIAKMESTFKTRFFPMHPVFSQLPGTICRNADENGNNAILVRCNGSKYPLRNTYYGIDGKANFVNNYQANVSFMAKGDYNAPQNIYVNSSPASGAALDGDRPVLMVKTAKLTRSQISAGPGPPTAGSTELVILEDYTPEDGGTLYNAGLHTVMYAQMPAAPATSVDFPLHNFPLKQPFLPTFAVEIQNLPLHGYFGKSFDKGRLDGRKGMGSRLPIVGMIPAREFPASSTDKILNYYYKTEYYQPVQLRLPTKQFINYLDINLRNIVSGKLLQDLIHATEVVFRFYPLPDELPESVTHTK